MEKFRISVRSLVEFLLHSGDIDGGKGGMADKEAMQLGSRIHRKIQGSMGAGYRPEVSLKAEIVKETFTLFVEGRADGILEQDGRITVDEIKGVYRSLDAMEKPDLLHLAQAKCYAAIYGSEQKLDVISVQMTYCNLETEEIRRFVQEFSVKELKSWFDELTEQYCKWCEMQVKWKTCRQESIHACVFPFPYREGQKQLAAAVYRTIAHRKKLFIQAPTGVGKTISTVFPTVKAVGENLGEKIFYLTAKTVTRTVAEEAFSVLKGKGLRYKVLTLTAKEKICPLEEVKCNPIECPYAKGHYDRVNDAVYDLITTEDDFTRERMLEQAEKYQVCPFEMSLDASLYADVIICDYNYVFDPNVYLKRFFSEGEKGDYIFLVDEAHNLVERGREMYSAVLIKEEILAVKKLVRGKDRKLEAALEKCNRQMLEWKRECEKYVVYESIGAFAFSLMRLMSLLDVFLQSRGEMPERKAITDFYLNLRHFMNMFERVDENYVMYTDFDDENRFCLHLYCVNPSVNLQECLERGNSTVFFSATLLPVNYYKNLLSSKKDNYAVYADSAFREEQRLLFIGRDVSSLYTRRTIGEFRRIALYIQQVLRAKKGNYLIFFPSYRFMEDVYEQFLAVNEREADCMIQNGNMNEAEREAFMQEFAEARDRSLAAFCVLGGIFSEGIDLKEDLLIGVLIVGTGLPQICTQREILKEYYQEENGQGFDYAYQYPGMNKVLQAAGRVIRTASDRGIIGLLDERFLRNDYRQLFPREWSQYEVHTLESLPGALDAFWKK